MSTVVVTGANGNLGSIVVPHLLSLGWSVTAVVRSVDDVGKGLAAEGATLRVADLASHESTASALADLPDDTSALVHLAGGIAASKPLQETTAAEVEKMFMLNTFTLFNISRLVLPTLLHNHGAIVAIGAQSVLHPTSNRSAYASSKAAVAALVLALAEEGRASGLRANCLLPSIIRTPENLAWAEGNAADAWVTPEQMAHTIAQLIHKDSSMTGALIPMYGKLPF